MALASFAGLVFFGVVFFLVMAALWLLIAGDRAGQMIDEEPTMDVQNHRGDR